MLKANSWCSSSSSCSSIYSLYILSTSTFMVINSIEKVSHLNARYECMSWMNAHYEFYNVLVSTLGYQSGGPKFDFNPWLDTQLLFFPWRKSLIAQSRRLQSSIKKIIDYLLKIYLAYFLSSCLIFKFLKYMLPHVNWDKPWSMKDLSQYINM